MRPPPRLAAPLFVGLVVAITATTLPGHAAPLDPTIDPLCGTTLTSDLTLTHDIDCVSYAGPAITIGADNVTLDGNGFRIIAPDASAAILVVNRVGVTIVDVDVSGWCGGTGVLIDGSTGATLIDVIADSRERGVYAKNADDLTIDGLTSNGAGLAGLSLEGLVSAPTLVDLSLTNGRSGLHLKDSGVAFTIDASLIQSLAGSDYGLWFESNVQNVTVSGLTLANNPGAAIFADDPTHASLTFQSLTLSGLGGGDNIGGYGLRLRGANHVITDITADDRQFGVSADGVTNLVATNITARRAGVAAFELSNAVLSAGNTLTLSNLALDDSNTSLRLSNVAGSSGAPLQITPTTLTSASNSRVGIELVGSSYIDLRDLSLDSWGTAVLATTGNNHHLRFFGLDLSALGPTHFTGFTHNRGLELVGADHHIEDLTVDGRAYAVRVNSATNLVVDGLTLSGSSFGLRLESSTLSASNSLTVSDVSCTGCTEVLTFDNVKGLAATPWVIDSTVLTGMTYSGRALNFINGSANFIVRGASAANRWALPTTGESIATQSNTANIRIEHVDVSGPGQGTGIIISGANHVLSDIVANQRETGVSATSTNNLRIETLSAAWASNAGLLLGSVSGTAPTLSGLSLTHSDRGLSLVGFNPPTQVTINPSVITTLANSRTGIYLNGSVARVTLADLTLDNPVRAILIENATVTNVVLQDLVLDGVGLGTGLHLSNGVNVTVRDVRADRREYGARLTNSGNIDVDGFRSWNSSVGFWINLTGATRVAPTLMGLDLQRNDVALKLENNTLPLTIGPANPADAASYLVTTGSTTSLALSQTASSGVATLRNLRLDGLAAGLSVFRGSSGASGPAPIITGVDASGAGIGQGFNLNGDATFTNVIANDRATGLVNNTSSGLVVAGFTARRSGTAIAITSPTNTPTAVPPVLSNLDLRGAATGLSLNWSGLPWTLNQSTVALDVTDTLTGISVSGSGALTFDGFVLPSRAFGLLATPSATGSLTLMNLDVSGVGLGYGIDLTGGTNHTLDTITADHRDRGVRITNANGLAITALTSRHTVKSLRLASPSGTVSLSNLHLEDAAPGLELSGYANALTLDATAFTSLVNTYPALTITTSPNVTVDAALGLTPTSGSWYGSLPASNPLCGTTLSGLTTLSADLDCSGTTGTAITLGAGATLDGAGFAILAPHASTVVLASGANSTLRDITVSGSRPTGTGVRVTSSATIDNVTAERRAIGFDLDGAADVSLMNATARHASDKALRIANPSGTYTFSNLTLERSTVGLYANNSGAGVGPGATDLTFGPSVITSLAHNATSIRFDTNASRYDVTGLTLDGYDFGVSSSGHDIDLTELIVSSTYLQGSGLGLNGRHVLTDITALGRKYGVDVTGTNALTINGLVARDNETGLRLNNVNLATAPATLAGLDLRTNNLALDLSSLTGPYTFTAAQFVTPVGGIRDNLSDLSLSGGSGLAFDNLTLGARNLGLFIGGGASACTFTDLTLTSDAAGGLGVDLRSATSGNTLDGLTVQGYANGVSLDGTANALTDLVIDGAVANGISLRGTDHSVSGLTVTNAAQAMSSSMGGITVAGVGAVVPAPGVILVDALSGNDNDLRLAAGTNVIVRDLALSGRDYGLLANGSNDGLIVRDVGSHGPAPAGRGIEIAANGTRLERVTVSQREYGVLIQNGAGVTLDEVSVVRAYDRAIQLQNMSSTVAAPIALNDLDLSQSGRVNAALRLINIDASAAPLVVGATSLARMSENLNDISVAGSSAVTFDGLRLNAANHALNGTGGQNTNLVFSNLDLSPLAPGGTGLTLDGSNSQIDGVIAHRRDTGVRVISSATGAQLSNISTRGSMTAIEYNASAPPATLTALDLRGAYTGIALYGVTGPWTLDGAAVGALDLAGAHRAIVVDNGTNNITLRGLQLPGLQDGLRVQSITTNVTVDDVDLSSVGTPYGTGASINGAGHTFTQITASNRQYGVTLLSAATEITVSNLMVSGAGQTALNVTSTTPPLALSGLTLTHSNLALAFIGTIGSSAAPFTLTGAALGTANWTGNRRALDLSLSANIAVTDAAFSTFGDAITTSSSTTNLRFTRLDVSRGSGQLLCGSSAWGGSGVSLGGIVHRLEDITALGRTIGIRLVTNHDTTLEGGLLAANVTGLRTDTGGATFDTTVVEDAANTATTFKVASGTNINAGRVVRVGLGTGAEDREVLSTLGSFITLATPLSAIPPTGTTIQTPNLSAPRVNATDLDICANTTGATTLSLLADLSGNHWRSAAGPSHANNPASPADTGDVLSGSNVTFQPYEPTAFDTVNPYCNAVPVPDAGPDQTTCEGDTGTLDASATSDPDDEPLAYAWQQLAGTTAALSSPSAVTTTFIAPPPATLPTETLTFELTVDDNDAVRTDTVVVVTQKKNTAPTASATGPGNVDEGAPVTLDASASTDPEGTPLTYLWTQVGGPAVTLTGPSTASPTFTAPDVGPTGDPAVTATLTFEVTVTDALPTDYCGTTRQASTTVTVTVGNVNRAPTADAGPDQTLDQFSPVSLDGTQSSDPDGDTLSYAWTQVAGPPVTLTDANSATPTFTAPGVLVGSEVLTFEVAIDDGFGGTDTDTVTITVDSTCIPSAATDTTCDDVDDDCDGGTDEDYVIDSSCFLQGACAAANVASSCTAGTETLCATGTPSAETCNNIDDDCDGTVDLMTRPTTCGEGACAATTGLETCTLGVWGDDTCDPLSGATAETCNDLDDDCDGTTDEDLAFGTEACVLDGGCAGTRTIQCVEGTPLATGACISDVTFDACNGTDDDCDGATDEDFTPEPASCGVDACAASVGVTTCTDGVPGETCDPLWSSIPDTTCGAGSSGLNVIYLIVTDANQDPIGSVRCFQDLAAPQTPVTCETLPNSDELVILPTLLCEGAAP